MNLYPVNLRINNKVCVIIGGGEVAARKIRPLLNCGARITVISPEAVQSIRALAENGVIEYRSRKYKEGDLEGAYLAFAATDKREIQRAIAAEAEQRGILLNSVDDPEACDFQVPARVRRGNFLMTVSTGGGSPALAAKVRRRLEKEYGLEYEQFVDLLAKIREKIVSDGNPSASHRALFEKLLQLDIVKRIQKEDWSALQNELCAVLPEELDVDELMESIIHGQG